MGLESFGIDICKKYVDFAQRIFDRHEIEISRCDALKYKKYHKYDIIYLYQPVNNGDVVRKLIRKIIKDMKKGAHLISIAYLYVNSTNPARNLEAYKGLNTKVGIEGDVFVGEKL
jgi:tRNA U55 pseudouridine synthase TruB